MREPGPLGFIHHNSIKWGLCDLLVPPPWIITQSYTENPHLKYSSADDVAIVGDITVRYQCQKISLKHPVRYVFQEGHIHPPGMIKFPKDVRDWAQNAMLHVYVALDGPKICGHSSPGLRCL